MDKLVFLFSEFVYLEESLYNNYAPDWNSKTNFQKN